MFSPSKTKKDENFPVASWIISTKLRPHIYCFYDCVRAADDVADNPNLSPKEKLVLLKQMDSELQGKSQKTDFVTPATKHITSSKETGVTIEHARHLLQAFSMDIEKKRYKNWSELINYCQYSAVPVGRFLLDLHSSGEEARKCTDRLCIALQILNHLQDCKSDYLELDRVYLPQDFFNEQNIDVTALAESFSKPELRLVFDALLDRINGMIKVARLELHNIKDKRLRFETAVILLIAKALSKKLSKKDPIAQNVKLSKLKKSLCILIGIWHGLKTF